LYTSGLEPDRELNFRIKKNSTEKKTQKYRGNNEVVTVKLLHRCFIFLWGNFLICRPESEGAAPMVNKLPPAEGAEGAPNPALEDTWAPKGLEVDEPNPDDGSPAVGVAGDAGWDPNTNGLLPPEPEAGVTANENDDDEGWLNVEEVLVESFCVVPNGFDGAELFDGAPNAKVFVLDAEEPPNEKEPVVDGRGGSFSAVRPKENGEGVPTLVWDWPMPKGLTSAGLSSVFDVPKGLEELEACPNENPVGAGGALFWPNKDNDVEDDGAELNENPLNEGRDSTGLPTWISRAGLSSILTSWSWFGGVTGRAGVTSNANGVDVLFELPDPLPKVNGEVDPADVGGAEEEPPNVNPVDLLLSLIVVGPPKSNLVSDVADGGGANENGLLKLLLPSPNEGLTGPGSVGCDPNSLGAVVEELTLPAAEDGPKVKEDEPLGWTVSVDPPMREAPAGLASPEALKGDDPAGLEPEAPKRDDSVDLEFSAEAPKRDLEGLALSLELPKRVEPEVFPLLPKTLEEGVGPDAATPKEGVSSVLPAGAAGVVATEPNEKERGGDDAASVCFPNENNDDWDVVAADGTLKDEELWGASFRTSTVGAALEEEDCRGSPKLTTGTEAADGEDRLEFTGASSLLSSGIGVNENEGFTIGAGGTDGAKLGIGGVTGGWEVRTLLDAKKLGTLPTASDISTETEVVSAVREGVVDSPNSGDTAGDPNRADSVRGWDLETAAVCTGGTGAETAGFVRENGNVEIGGSFVDSMDDTSFAKLNPAGMSNVGTFFATSSSISKSFLVSSVTSSSS
jgi:hypothetical protein